MSSLISKKLVINKDVEDCVGGMKQGESLEPASCCIGVGMEGINVQGAFPSAECSGEIKC